MSETMWLFVPNGAVADAIAFLTESGAEQYASDWERANNGPWAEYDIYPVTTRPL